MEPKKITSTADLDLEEAARAAKGIESLIEGLRYQAPEDGDGTATRLRAIAGWIDVLTARLKITPPGAPQEPGKSIAELQASLARHRETERRHRDQRAGICDLLQTHWDQVEHRVKELIEDARVKIDLIGEVRAAAATAGLEVDQSPTELVKAMAGQLAAHRQSSAPPSTYVNRLTQIHVALHADGLVPTGADPLNPVDSVQRLIEERRELLEEMARGASPEMVAVAASELGDQAERGADVPWTFKKTAEPEPTPDPPLGPHCEGCSEKLCPRCNRCHAIAGFMRGCELSDPPCDHEAAPVDILPGALRVAHEALIAVMSASERDWTRAADLAWIYGVLVGWSQDDLEEMQIRFGWREQTARIIDEHRAALVCAGMAE